MQKTPDEKECDTEMDHCPTQSKKKRKKKVKSKKPKVTDPPLDDGIKMEDIAMDEDDDSHSENEEQPADAYIPGHSRPLMEDEVLVMDKSSYRLYHELQVESACLSFDILLDNLGSDRIVEVNGPPISLCLIAGTQASNGVDNKLVVMKLNNMNPFHRKERTEEDEKSESDSDDDSSSDEEDLDSKPELDAASVNHKGIVNRLRAHRFEGRYLAASWSELGTVSVWDLTRPLTAVNDSVVMSEYVRHGESPKPLYTHKGHKTEGFALDWSPHPNASGHLASGDGNGCIYHWIPRPSGWTISRTPYTGHTASVEDIQWSITEPTVFITASADHSIRVWDTRSPTSAGSMLTVAEAHPEDVNVVSWNRLQPVHVLTGGDDGSLRIWDLRLVNKHNSDSSASKLPAYTQLYDFHKAPITSVEWHPTDAGVFVASSEDDQVTIWDSTLEQADQQTDNDANGTDNNLQEIPVQLLFIHSGHTEVKETHWHPQIPGLLVVTSLDGFNVFRTCNV